ncbi:MAG: CsgG/HfaB family protein [Luteibaculaceae bacterium]
MAKLIPLVKYPLFLVLIFAFSACNPSNKFLKRGERLAEAGFHQEASDYFLRSLAANRNNLEARAALRQSGQISLEKQFDGLFAANAKGNHREAVEIWMRGDRYRQQVARFGVELEMPSRFERMFIESRDIYLNELFTEGEMLMEQERFTEAERVFREINKIEPDFRNVAELKSVAIVEPRYREAVTLFNNSRFREAYRFFEKVEQKAPNYKDTRRLMEDCLLFGQFPIIVEPFQNAANSDERVGERITALLTNAFTNLNDPFIKVVDRRNLDRVMEEQRLAMSGIARSNQGFTELVAAAGSVSGSVIEFRRDEGRLTRAVKNGFVSVVTQQADGEGNMRNVTQYTPVNYFEFSQTNSVTITLQYQLISMQNGQIIATDVITVTNSDSMGYVDFEGNINTLFPANANGQVNNNRNAVRTLREMAGGKRTIAPVEQIATDLYRQSADKVAREIQRRIDKI